jgi:hypothetical protein
VTFGTVIVVLAAIFAITFLIRSRHNARLGHWDGEHSQPLGNPQREAELRREIEELRERVHVLERIATDGTEAKRLSAEIERLRDGR